MLREPVAVQGIRLFGAAMPIDGPSCFVERLFVQNVVGLGRPASSPRSVEHPGAAGVLAWRAGGGGGPWGCGQTAADGGRRGRQVRGTGLRGSCETLHVSVLPLSSCSSFPLTDCRSDELHASVALRDRRAAADAAA